MYEWCYEVTLCTANKCNNHNSVKIRLVATCHLQTCYNLLKQLAASLWITSFDNKLVSSLVTTCNKLSQAMRTHPDIDLLMTSLLQELARFKLCSFRRNQHMRKVLAYFSIVEAAPCRAPHQGDGNIERARELSMQASLLSSRISRPQKIIPGLNADTSAQATTSTTTSQSSSQPSSKPSSQNVTRSMAGMTLQVSVS